MWKMSENLSVGSNHIGGSTEDIDVGSFNFDIEELDDAEYQIPHVAELPTLESILNDTYDRLSINEDNDSLHFSQGLHASTALGIEGGSETLSLASQRSRGSFDRKGATSTAYLRHVLLKGISTQITSASERVDAGTATAVTVSTMVAVGTSHGLVLVFDGRQTLRWCLMSPDKEQGAVTSLCFNYDSSRLLVGFARGHILMFDITNGKLLRTLSDVHPPGTAVLSVKFTDSPTLALCSDSGGSVFELCFRRTLGVRGCDSKCLFSGSRGEVCVLEPLHMTHVPTHPLQGIILVAMATLSKVIVVSIRPKMRVVLVRALPPGSLLLPLLSWQFVLIQVGSSSKVIDPVLAFAKENTVQFFQISVDAEYKLRMAPLQKVILHYSLISLHWLNTWTIAAVDVNERLHLLDIHTHEELEAFDMSHIGMMYESSSFKGIYTGGNVSPAMALAGEKACYNTIVCHGSQVLVLCAKSVHVLSIRPWTDRLNYLVKQKKYLTALSLGLSFYEEPKGAVGLKGSRERRQEIAKGKVIQILEQFVEDMDNPIEDIPACVQYAVSIRYTELIFTKLWENVLLDPATKVIYLESLEPLILNEQLYTIPPIILQQFVNCYESSGKLQALEACLIHLDISSLDLHQVMQICWAHGLYDVIIHVHNRALIDYTTPIHELVPIVQKAIDSGNELSGKQVELGNKLLVYVSCCLAGRGYPIGEIPRDSIQTAKHEVFACLTSVHSKDASDDELPYPYLRTLVHFDAREFLNVVSLAFTEPEFTSELGLRQRQRLLDILSNLILKSPGFSDSEKGALYTFIARQLARPSSGLSVEPTLARETFRYLTDPAGSHRQERQQAVLELLKAGGLELLGDCDKAELLRLVEAAGFFRVCEVLYEQSGEWDQVFLCYLRDPHRLPQVFSFLRNILVLYRKESESRAVVDQTCAKISTLIRLNPVQTCNLVSEHLMHRLTDLLQNLTGPEQLTLLKGVLYDRDKEALNESPNPAYPEHLDKYITLTLQLEPRSAMEVLRRHSEGWDLSHLLGLVTEPRHARVRAFLLEERRDSIGAFQVLKERLEGLVNGTEPHETTDIEETVTEMVGVIQRSATRGLGGDEEGEEPIRPPSEAETLKMWTDLLNVVIVAQNSIQPKDKTRLIQSVLGGTVGHAQPADILKYLLHHPAYSGATFGDIRYLLTGMLDNFRYEQSLLTTAQRLVSSDQHHKVSSLLTSARRAVRPLSSRCAVCSRPLTDPVLVFPCGHVTHEACCCPFQCPVCSEIALDKADSQTLPSTRSRDASCSDLLQGHHLTLKLSAPPVENLDNVF